MSRDDKFKVGVFKRHLPPDKQLSLFPPHIAPESTDKSKISWTQRPAREKKNLSVAKKKKKD